ncbi:MAG: hypothetical protein QOH25_2441 [Acidobacteriota bacterium]|jgi:O-antigen ligase|nr:hypothetical protein [Acidobacteriota bacterium]
MNLKLNKTADEVSTATTAHGRQIKKIFASYLERILLGFLFLMVLSAPHSIAATQIAWSGALLAWGLSFLLRPRPRLHRTPIDFPMLLFFILTIVSALFSYDPDVSIPLLRGAFLFTIVYLFAQNIHSRRLLRLLVLCLIASCMLNVIYTLGERIVGRGVKVEGLNTASPLFVAGIRDGDILLEVDGRSLRQLNELSDALASAGRPNDEPAHVQVYSYEWGRIIDVPRGHLLDGASASEKLGVGSWSRGRDWRASGFYGHYTTYSEVLQLIASLSVGLFIAIPRKRSLQAALLVIVILGQSVALLLTVTRASWLAFLISIFVIILVGASRRMVLVVAACALVIIPAALFVLQQKRNVGFFDSKDGSTTYRETVWREGFALLTSKPRHLLVGVGMNSIIRHRREWGLFDHGRLPMGHMHSTPLQLALERGVPALLVWLVLLFVYGRMLFWMARSPKTEGWIERGTALGALGGLIGFLSSGIVHYNWGDSEVVMIFYIIMGINLAIKQKTGEKQESEVRIQKSE